MTTGVYIIAELGNNHDGSFGIARQMIKAAADCGVDAVKIQTHFFSEESLTDAPNPPYFKSESRQEYFDRTSFSKSQYLSLLEYSTHLGVDFLSSPFSEKAVFFLEEIGVSKYKIPSGELTNTSMLKLIAQTNKPVILSTGMSSLDEIDIAVNILLGEDCKDLTLLQCTSEYPCPPDSIGLNMINEFSDRYKLDIGFSDHTLGMAAPIAAVTLGAKIIEKHFTLSQLMYGSDAKHSMEPQDFKQMVRNIREIEQALSNPVNKNDLSKKLIDMKHIFEKSIVASIDIPIGVRISKEMLAFKKPGNGISASNVDNIIGKKTRNFISANTILKFEDLDIE